VPRVALLCTSLARGGAETQVYHLAMELRRRGWEVAVVSLLPPAAFTAELEAAGIAVSSLDMRPGAADPRGLARLVATLHRFRPQVLHSHLFHANLMARAARLLCPVPVVVSTLHSIAESGRASRGTRLRDWAYRLTAPLADAVVSVSQAVAERHHQRRVIPNGVDLSVYRPDPERRARTRAALGLGNAFVWLAAGRLMWKKDYPTLLRAFARLRGAVLLVAGEGPEEAALRELSVEPRFLGRRDDIPALMNAADGLALSSVVEGLPMVLLEAAASGLPAVATAVGGVREIVVEGETGFVVPPGDPEALAAAMARLAALSGDERERMLRAARARAEACFDVRVVAARWDELYRELLERAPLWT
jgi:glycosyltransferase involved in cell wall biosynthesis